MALTLDQLTQARDALLTARAGGVRRFRDQNGEEVEYTAFNRPFTSNGFGNRFRKWCDEAGLPQCSVHGLRKAAAARLAELGCTEQEIMSITGHQTSKEVTRYTRAASQKTRAESALRRLSREQTPDESVPLLAAVVPGGTKSQPK